jgi:hypothetical protein
MLRPSQEKRKRRTRQDPAKQRRDNKRSRLKSIVGSDNARRSRLKVTLPTFSFSNDKDPP